MLSGCNYQNITSFREALEGITEAEIKIGVLGGRYFIMKAGDKKISTSIKEIYKNYLQLVNKSADFENILFLQKRIEQIDNIANTKLLSASKLQQILTSIKRWFGNCFNSFDKSQVQNQINAKIKELSSKQRNPTLEALYPHKVNIYLDPATGGGPALIPSEPDEKCEISLPKTFDSITVRELIVYLAREFNKSEIWIMMHTNFKADTLLDALAKDAFQDPTYIRVSLHSGIISGFHNAAAELKNLVTSLNHPKYKDGYALIDAFEKLSHHFARKEPMKDLHLYLNEIDELDNLLIQMYNAIRQQGQKDYKFASSIIYLWKGTLQSCQELYNKLPKIIHS